MKITITAVSVPALRQIQAFRKRYEQQYPEDDLTIVCFYVAGQEQRYVLEPEKIIAMVAYQFSLEKLQLMQRNDTTPYTEKVKELTELLEDYFQKE